MQHAVGGLAEDGVAGEVAEGVVDLVEVVDVGQDEGEVIALSVGALQLVVQDVEDGGAVPEAGECVPRGLAVEGFAGGKQLGPLGFELAGAARDELTKDLLLADEVRSRNRFRSGGQRRDRTAGLSGLPTNGPKWLRISRPD